jgi:hypothetical protein
VSVEPPRQFGIVSEPPGVREFLKSEAEMPVGWIGVPEAFDSTKVRETGIDPHAGARRDQQGFSLPDRLCCPSDLIILVHIGRLSLPDARKKSLELCSKRTEVYPERSIVMSEVQPTMTGLEFRFEEELSSVPGLHRKFREIEHSPSATPQKETEQDKAVEEAMILGV